MLGVGLTIILGDVEQRAPTRPSISRPGSRHESEARPRGDQASRRRRNGSSSQRSVRDALALLAGGLAHDFNNLLELVVYAAFEQAELEVRPGGGRAEEALASSGAPPPRARPR